MRQVKDPAVVSVITSREPAILSKSFRLSPDGSLEKHNGGALFRGSVQRQTVRNPRELADLLSRLNSQQALCFGVPDRDAEIVPISELSQHPGAIARTREFFRWLSGNGVMLLDYDPEDGRDALPFADLLVALTQAMADLAMAPMVAYPSASSGIYSTDGTEKRGVRGWHLFCFVKDATDIPVIGETLHKRLWLAGHGKIHLSKSGAALFRTLVDSAVWQPERLSFDGGAHCGAGLRQDRGQPIVRNPDAEPMPTPRPLNQSEEVSYRKMIAQAKAEQKDKIAAVQAKWVEDRLTDTLIVNPTADAELVKASLLRAVAASELMGDFVLTAQDGRSVTVGELLDQPERWHNKEFFDPLEPGYSGGDKRIAVAKLLGGRPILYSHAHGGKVYRLAKQARVLLLLDGHYPEHLKEIADRLGRDHSIFDYGGALVTVADGHIIPLRPPGLAHIAEQAFAFTKHDARKQQEKACQLPPELAGRLIEARDCWQSIQKLTAVVSHPIIRADGSIVDRDGYDEDTGLLLHSGRDWHLPASTTRAEVQQAVALLWKPVSMMPWESPADAGAALSLLLTAVARPSLDLAPMFLIGSPTYGSGKTILAQVAALLAGADGSVTSISQEENEQAKAILSLLLAGTPAVVLDNLSGELRGDSLAAMLTGSTYRGRILGQSQIVELPTRMLWTVSGVNISPGADLVRRCITVRVDPCVERPEERHFPFHPVTMAREHLPGMQEAALTVLRAACQAGAWDRAPTQAVGSFDQWDRMVRRTILWLISSGLAPITMADPLETQVRERGNDSEASTLEGVLAAWFGFVGSDLIGATTLINRAMQDTAVAGAAEILRMAQEIAGGVNGQVNPKRWGRFLSKSKGRVAGGYRLTQPSTNQGQRQWQVALVAKVPSPHTPRANVSEPEGLQDISGYGVKVSHQRHQSNPKCLRCDDEGCAYCRGATGVSPARRSTG